MQFPASENTNRIEPQQNTHFCEQKYVCNVCCVLSPDQLAKSENHTLHTLHFESQIYATFEGAPKSLNKTTSLTLKKKIIFANKSMCVMYVV